MPSHNRGSGSQLLLELGSRCTQVSRNVCNCDRFRGRDGGSSEEGKAVRGATRRQASERCSAESVDGDSQTQHNDDGAVVDRVRRGRLDQRLALHGCLPEST